MRLNSKEITSIRHILGELDPLGQVYLFGSRVDDSRKGGDIDIFLNASRIIELKTQLTIQYRLTTACNTHVDLLVKNPNQSMQPIHEIALETGIKLWPLQWIKNT